MKFLDLYAGIGGFRLGMEQAGHECVGYVEIDKFARKSYQAIHDAEEEWTARDITTITDDDVRQLGDRGRIDIICGGFPCQAFSVAGNRGGFDDTRGTLFFEIARIANIIRPQYLFLENVKGLLNHDRGNTFEIILRALDELRYDAEWQVLNSKDFGVPQNRERVFIVGHLRGSGGRKIFPIREGVQIYSKSKQIEKETNETALCLTAKGNANWTGNFIQTASHNVQAVLTPGRLEKRQNGRRFKDNGEPMFTLTSQDRHGVSDGHRIRKLTPKECWRLQGFPDWTFDEAAKVNSDSQLYKQAGNSVTVNVIYEIARRITNEHTTITSSNDRIKP